MAVFDIFSKRKALNSGKEDIYQYDDAPEKLRIQTIHIFDEAVGNNNDFHNDYGVRQTKWSYDQLTSILRREYGQFRLSPKTYDNDNTRTEFLTFILNCSVDHFIDAVELGARMIERYCSTWSDNAETCADAISELNVRFRESSFGFQYEEGVIIRVDTEFAHKEITKPALQILGAKHLKGAREEFLSAHEHYKDRKFKESISDCLKSFESTMKAICTKRKWNVAPNATAKGLIEACFANELIPTYMQSQFTSLKSILEAGVPTTRNRTSGHGQGIAPIGVPDYLAAFVLHQTASVLIFLEKSDQNLS